MKTLLALVLGLTFGAGPILLMPLLSQEKKYPSPDGVNTITDHGNGLLSTTLAHPTEPILISAGSRRITAYTADDFAHEHGRYPLTKSEAGEICASLIDSAMAHDVALDFYDTALKQFGPTSTKADRERMEDNLKRCAQSGRRTLDLLKKWQERKEKLRD